MRCFFKSQGTSQLIQGFKRKIQVLFNDQIKFKYFSRFSSHFSRALQDYCESFTAMNTIQDLLMLKTYTGFKTCLKNRQVHSGLIHNSRFVNV